MKEICRVFKKHVTRIISYEKKEMIPLTKKKKKKCIISKRSVMYSKKDLLLMIPIKNIAK